jgi:hypothetical protein
MRYEAHARASQLAYWNADQQRQINSVPDSRLADAKASVIECAGELHSENNSSNNSSQQIVERLSRVRSRAQTANQQKAANAVLDRIS